MVDWAIAHDGPAAIRYPKTAVERLPGPRTPLELGRAELVAEGGDGLVLACGTLLGEAVKAAATLREEGLELTVVNARFVKPLDTTLLLERIEAAPWTITIEENALPTGFGSAILEMVSDAHLAAGPIVRLGLPDRFVEHGERGELLAALGLDAAGIAATCRRLAGRDPRPTGAVSHAAVDH
jgi:1-deoxy-D-xylulose-5-phosphate synthase